MDFDKELDGLDDMIASHYADESDGMGASPFLALEVESAARSVLRAARQEAEPFADGGTE